MAADSDGVDAELDASTATSDMDDKAVAAWVEELSEQRDAEMAKSQQLNRQHREQRQTLTRRAENAKKFAEETSADRRELERAKRAQLRRRRGMLRTFAATMVVANLGAFVLAMSAYAHASAALAVVVFFPASFALTGILSAR